MSIESVMPSHHVILCRPLLLLPSIFPSISKSVLRIRWAKRLRDRLPPFPGFGQSRQRRAQWLPHCMSRMASLREAGSCLICQARHASLGGKGGAKCRRAGCRGSRCRGHTPMVVLLRRLGGPLGPQVQEQTLNMCSSPSDSPAPILGLLTH